MSDEDHGGANNIPEDYGDKEIETTEDSTPKMTDTSSKSSENHLYLCHYCNELFKGERGLSIHLETADRSPMHPDSASLEDEEYTLIPADEDYEPFMDMDEIYQITKRRRRRNEILDDF